MNGPDVSVIIPIYNAENSIKDCLDSVLSQKGVSLEVIAVDDGSTDSTPDILASIAERDGRVSVVRGENKFAGVARNLGIDRASGKYLAFLDADDLLLDGALARMHRIATKKRAELVKAGFIYRDTETGEEYRTLYSKNASISCLEKLFTTSFYKNSYRTLGIADVPWNALYESDFIRKNRIRFNSLRCVNDHSFFIECLLRAERIAVTSAPVVKYSVSQSGSLIGKKAYYFENQTASYAIVKELTKGLEPKLSKRVLSRELYNLFGWYERFAASDDETARASVHAEMKRFLAGFDEGEVGVDFLCEFAHAERYFELRGEAPPRKRPGKLKRGIICLRENGLRYTLSQLFGA